MKLLPLDVFIVFAPDRLGLPGSLQRGPCGMSIGPTTAVSANGRPLAGPVAWGSNRTAAKSIVIAVTISIRILPTICRARPLRC